MQRKIISLQVHVAFISESRDCVMTDQRPTVYRCYRLYLMLLLALTVCKLYVHVLSFPGIRVLELSYE
jgi:hypothetical protein